MPSGYTSKIYEGEEVSGKEFLLTCARAFGACIEMRDEDSDVPIPEKFEVSGYHEKNLKDAIDRLAKYKSMSVQEADLLSQAEFEKDEKHRLEEIEKGISLKSRYDKTLNEVEKWIPPTDEHKELKEYAINQLKESIKFDCPIDYYLENTTKKLAGQQWLDSKIAGCLKNIEYHSIEQDKEIERINGRNNWIKQLRESLK